MTYSDLFSRIEEEFQSALDERLHPRSPELLFDIVRDLGLPARSTVIDVGCGEGRHALRLATEFGFTVLGIDPLPRHVEIAGDELGSVAAHHADLRHRVVFTSGRADAVPVESAIVASGLRVDECFDLGTEWGEFAEEDSGKGGRQLLHAARLLRAPSQYKSQFGQDAYDIMLGDCLWHVYRMIGKLRPRAYLLTLDSTFGT